MNDRNVNSNDYESHSVKSSYSDDDEDSLGCALNDYNGIFYDAPTTTSDDDLKYDDMEITSRKIEISVDKHMNMNNEEKFANSKSDDEIVSSGIEEDEDRYLPLNDVDDNDKSFDINNDHEVEEDVSKIQKRDSQEMEKDNDLLINEQINLEFENYLNDDNDFENLISEPNDQRKMQNKRIEELKSKIRELEDFNFESNDLDKLRDLAISKYGFVNKKFRRKAWPLLLNKSYHFNNNSISSVNENNSDETSKIEGTDRDNHNENSETIVDFDKITESQIKKNKYFNQVTLDVVRTLKRFPPEISDNLRLKLQNELIELICKILVKHDNLHYYQGYHDICLTFLLVTGVQESLPLLESLTLSHLTCFMETTMESTLKLLFNIMPLIDLINPSVAEHIQRAELGVIFCLSWLITWYSHVMDNLRIILRLYDFFIATNPLMPIYLGAIIVSDKAEDILNIDCDMASLHSVISKYPSRIDDLESIENDISKALKLFEKYPPNMLSNLNEKWLETCKLIQTEKEKEELKFNEIRNRHRSNNRNNKRDELNDDDDKVLKSNRLALANRKPKLNRLFFGLTVTVGVAAFAMYAINTARQEPQDLLSKVYHLLTYKDFL